MDPKGLCENMLLGKIRTDNNDGRYGYVQTDWPDYLQNLGQEVSKSTQKSKNGTTGLVREQYQYIPSYHRYLTIPYDEMEKKKNHTKR